MNLSKTIQESALLSNKIENQQLEEFIQNLDSIISQASSPEDAAEQAWKQFQELLDDPELNDYNEYQQLVKQIKQELTTKITNAYNKYHQIDSVTETKEVADKMSIIVCGPPHSGKSVFFATLKNHLPRRGTFLHRCCPDGEGTWSQMADSETAQMIRDKGKFSAELVNWYQKVIQGVQVKRVLIDVGGLRTPENAQIFSGATHFIVLCRSDKPEEKAAWEKFGKDLGLTLIASLDSELTGTEKSITKDEEGVIRGNVVGLDRDNSNIQSTTIDVVASQILETSPEDDVPEELVETVGEIQKINLDTLAHTLKIPSRKEDVYQPHWTAAKVKEAVDLITDLDLDEPIWLDGYHPAFLITAIIAELAPKQVYLTDYFGNTEKVETLDYEIKEKPDNLFKWNVEEREDYTFVDLKIPGNLFDMENNYDQVRPPFVNPKKGVVLSGKLPIPIFASLVRSYKKNVEWVGIFTPQQKIDADMKTPTMIISGENTGTYIETPLIPNTK